MSPRSVDQGPAQQHFSYPQGETPQPEGQRASRAPRPTARPGNGAPSAPAATYQGNPTHAQLPPAYVAFQGMQQPHYTPFPQQAHLPNAVPAMNAARFGDRHPVGLNEFNKVLTRTRSEINDHLKKHPLQRNAGRLITILGTLGAIGAGVGTGVAVLGGTFGTLSGIGIPAAAAAALGGVGIGLAGIGVAALAGASTRAIARRAVAKDPHLKAKIEVLQQMQAALLAKPKLAQPEKVLLRNVNIVLGKVGGFKGHLKSQLKLAGKTGGIAVASVALLAVLGLAANGADGDGNGGFFFLLHGPLLNTPVGKGAAGAELTDHQGTPSFDAGQMQRWFEALNAKSPTP